MRDAQLPGFVRAFVYLPYEHAESMAMQDRAVALFEAAARDDPRLADMATWAHRHRDVVARFGRSIVGGGKHRT